MTHIVLTVGIVHTVQHNVRKCTIDNDLLVTGFYFVMKLKIDFKGRTQSAECDPLGYPLKSNSLYNKHTTFHDIQ